MVIPFKSTNICRGHPTGQYRIFSVSLLCSSPPGISLQIHSRSPSGKPECWMSMINHACLPSGYTPCLSNQLRIPGSTHTDRLWKRCCDIRLSQMVLIVSTFHTMCRLTSQRKSRDSQPLNIRSPGGKTHQFLFYRHIREQPVQSLFLCQTVIPKRCAIIYLHPFCLSFLFTGLHVTVIVFILLSTFYFKNLNGLSFQIDSISGSIFCSADNICN